MADCDYCGKLVSPNATRCPHCGEPNPSESSYSGGSAEEPAYGYIVGYTTLACAIAGPPLLCFVPFFGADKMGDEKYFVYILAGIIMGAIIGCVAGTVLYWIWGIIVEPILKLFGAR